MQPIGSGAPATQRVAWRKSRHSNPSGNCVEVAALPDGRIAVRDSRDPDGPRLTYTRGEVGAFVRGAKAGAYDSSISEL